MSDDHDWIEEVVPQGCPPEVAASHLFVHGVCERLAEAKRDPNALRQRVDAAMRITSDSPARQPRRGRAFVLAASVCIAVGWVVHLARDRAPSLSAAVRQVVATAALPDDLGYEFVIHGRFGYESRGQLFVRGNERFVAKLELASRELWVGFDGGSRWLVPPRESAPVFVTKNSHEHDEAMSSLGARMPFFRLARVLARIPDDFEVEETTDGAEPDALEFRARGVGRRGPMIIRVRARASDRVVERVEIEWHRRSWRTRDRAEVPWRSMHLRLVDESARADAWYRHDAHHDARREIRRR